jgi:excisionase family DNA binding protein
VTGQSNHVERLLTVNEVAELLATTERFPRRLIAERRIEFVRVGRHVRIPESALREFVAAGLVEPIAIRRTHEKGLRDRNGKKTLRKSPATGVREMAGTLPGTGRHGPAST